MFFGAVIAPTVFKSLSTQDAGVFLRRLFPRLYLFCGVTTGLATILLAVSGKWLLMVIIGVACALFFYCRGPLTTSINDARDRELAGALDAKNVFDRLHKRSVRIFGVQAVALVGVSVFLHML